MTTKKHRPPARDEVTLIFHPGLKIGAVVGETILNASWRAGIALESSCGGQGWCGRCRVRISPPPPPAPEDTPFFSQRELEEGWRLACRSEVRGSASIEAPAGRKHTDLREASLPVAGAIPAGLGPTAPSAAGYGFAVDVGTTTMTAQLWETGERQLLDTATADNPQASFGADIISRIAASRDRSTLARLCRLLSSGVSDLLLSLLKRQAVAAGRVTVITVAGNTAMQHFLAGEDPSPLAVAPFRPAFLERKPEPARVIGLRGFPRAVVRFIPGASAFVGGDAVAGTLAVLAGGKRAPSLLIDMGTNAELVLIRSRSLAATSAAAGPALEGGNLSVGRRAMPGAVEETDFAGDIVLRTIGGGPPLGLCGSGAIDLTALLLRFGLLLPDGRLLRPEETSNHPWRKLASRLNASREASSFVLAAGSGTSPALTFTQEDIRELQLAKAAIATAWQLLLQKARLRKDDVRQVYLAGSFGYSLRPRSLSAVGIIPPEWEDRVAVIGNASLAGATLCLLDDDAGGNASRIARETKTYHLAETKQFRRLFIHNLSFPS